MFANEIVILFKFNFPLKNYKFNFIVSKLIKVYYFLINKNGQGEKAKKEIKNLRRRVRHCR